MAAHSVVNNPRSIVVMSTEMPDYRNSTLDVRDHTTPPTPVISDYVQIVYLTIVFCFGAPLNMYTFCKLSRQYHVTKSRILLLSLHLNVSDLFILFFNALAKICWLITYRWTAGLAMCKILKFAQSLSLTLSSNVVVCIGMDRLLSLLQPLQIKAVSSWRCKQMLAAGWVLALATSAPQVHVFTVYHLTPDWAQCTDVWSIWGYLNISTVQSNRIKVAYGALHLLVAFWLPFILLIVCYAIILKKVYKSLGHDQQVQVIRTRSDSANNRRSPQNSGINNNRSSDSATSSTVAGIVGCLQPVAKAGAASAIAKNVGLAKNRTVVSLRRSLPTTNQTLESAQQRPLLRRNVGEMRVRRTKYRTLKITIVIVCAYVVFWLPYNSLGLWELIDHASYSRIEDYVYFFYGLISINAVINPIIYSRLSFFWCGAGASAQRRSRRPSVVRFAAPNKRVLS